MLAGPLLDAREQKKPAFSGTGESLTGLLSHCHMVSAVSPSLVFPGFSRLAALGKSR
jgi:hypothetical protein